MPANRGKPGRARSCPKNWEPPRKLRAIFGNIRERERRTPLAQEARRNSDTAPRVRPIAGARFRSQVTAGYAHTAVIAYRAMRGLSWVMGWTPPDGIYVPR